MTKLKDIKEFNMLQRNLELTKALQDVDKLKAENIELKTENNDSWDQLAQQDYKIRELKEEIVKLKTERLNSKL